MPIYTKVSGAIKEVKKVYTKVNGVIKEATNLHIKNNGAIEKVFSAINPPPTPNTYYDPASQTAGNKVHVVLSNMADYNRDTDEWAYADYTLDGSDISDRNYQALPPFGDTLVLNYLAGGSRFYKILRINFFIRRPDGSGGYTYSHFSYENIKIVDDGSIM